MLRSLTDNRIGRHELFFGCFLQKAYHALRALETEQGGATLNAQQFQRLLACCTSIFLIDIQRLTSLSTNDTPKESSQYIREDDARMLQEIGLVLGRWAWFSGALLNAKFDVIKTSINIGLSQRPATHAIRVMVT